MQIVSIVTISVGTPWAEPISRTQLHSSDSMVIYGFEPFDYELYPSK